MCDAGVTWGSWPDWIAAIATGLAFIIAAVTYARSTRDHRKSQARLVYATIDLIKHYEQGEEGPLLLGGARIGGGEGFVIVPSTPGVQPIQRAVAPLVRAVVRIHNGSDELMGPAKIQLYNTGLKKLFDRVSMFTGLIEPHSDYLVDMSVINEQHPGQPGVGTVIIFRDSSNRWWKRHGYEPIERIHDDPNNTADTPAEREGRAARHRHWSREEIEPLPRLTLRVRLYRMMRRLRGKQPIP